MVMNQAQENHLIDFVNVLVYYQPIEFVDEDIQFVFTLDLIMFLVENLPLYFHTSYLLSSWEYQYQSN